MAVANAVIRVDEDFFHRRELDGLLGCFREHAGDLEKRKELFHEALDRIKQKNHIPEGDTTSILLDDMRKQWKNDRIRLYNDFLLLALGAEDTDCNWDRWLKDQKLWDDRSNLELESIFKYMLDFIHEDEEIMFKFYRDETGLEKPSTRPDKLKKWRKEFYWLVQSLKIYRMHFSHPVVDVLKGNWDESNKDSCKELLKKAMEVFKEKVSLHARISWSKRSWRNRARLYWLLGLSKHAPISNGRLGNFKSLDYVGPIGRLVQEMIQEDEDLLIGKVDKDLTFSYRKAKYHDKVKKELLLGHLKVCRVLSWASAANDLDLVVSVLQHNPVYMKFNPDCDYKWEKAWEESWAMALWNASYRGHAKIVKKLLKCKFQYHVAYSKYFSREKIEPEPPQKGAVRHSKMDSPQHELVAVQEPPLHVAVRRGHISVVNGFGSAASKNFSCHEENAFNETPLEVTTKRRCTNPNELAIKRNIQRILLQRPEVKDAVEESSKQRELTVFSANAIIVGATLIASITFGGWLQPPLGYNSYYQFAEPEPAPPDSYESYVSIQGHRTIQVFAVFNSLSFFFAIAAVIAGIGHSLFHRGYRRYLLGRDGAKVAE